jgi:S1-C subfamily serine protease
VREFLSRRIFLKSFIFFVLVSGLVMFFSNKFESEVVLESTSNKFYTTNNTYSELEGFDKILKLQDAFIRNAKKIKPAVVSINGLQQIKKVSWQNTGGDKFNWLLTFKDWFSNTFRKKYKMEYLGSGFIYDERGYILTNYHVVEGYDQFLIKLSDQRKLTADKIGVDPKTDLAVLKIFSLKNFPSPEFGSDNNLNVGEWVMAIGNPYGLEGTVTVGVISGKGRSDLGIASFENFLQTDASINPGNSGGPLINIDGEIIGINTAVAEIGSGVGFAIPIDMARGIAADLILDGEVTRGWLGVGIQTLTPKLAQTFNVPVDTKGILVSSVEEGSPAHTSGIKQGDIIFSYNGSPIPDTKSLKILVAESKVGKIKPIKIFRNGIKKTVDVEIGKSLS